MKVRFLGVMVFLFTILLVGCVSPATDEAATQPAEPTEVSEVASTVTPPPTEASTEEPASDEPTATPTEEEGVELVDATGETVVITDTSRILPIGGSITEIVYALGAGDQVIARDDSSLYPRAVNDLESVGYIRTMSAEPILAVDPTLIITTEDAGPPEAVDQLKASGVTFLMVPTDESIEGVIEKITMVAAALEKEDKGAALVDQLEADFTDAQSLVEGVDTRPRVMFLYARGAGAVSVAGTNTGAATMIELAGGENAVTEFEGYQPITAEAVVAAAPDVILMMTRGLDSLDGVEGLLEQPGIAATPAGENERVIVMDDLYLLGFSTRMGTAVLDLTYLLHENLEAPLLTQLRSDGRFETLLMAVDAAGQTALLGNDNPLTVFAPTDDAFDSLPEGTLQGLMSSPISLQAVLSYHLLDDSYTFDELAALTGQPVQTLYVDGQLSIATADGTLTINNNADVIGDGILASNGIIYALDSVLLPERP